MQLPYMTIIVNDNQSREKSGLLLKPLFYCPRLMRKMFIDQALYEKEREIDLH